MGARRLACWSDGVLRKVVGAGLTISMLGGGAAWAAASLKAGDHSSGHRLVQPAGDGSHATPGHPSPDHGRTGARRCPKLSDYRPTLRPHGGPAGTKAAISGAIPMYGENGRYEHVPATDLTAWWNLKPGRWVTALGSSPSPSRPGRVRVVGHEVVKASCDFEMTFMVPAARPGTYPLVVLYSGTNGSTARYPATHFKVTR